MMSDVHLYVHATIPGFYSPEKYIAYSSCTILEMDQRDGLVRSFSKGKLD